MEELKDYDPWDIADKDEDGNPNFVELDLKEIILEWAQFKEWEDLKFGATGNGTQ